MNDTSLEKLWSVPLESSYSGPIVYDDVVITTETREKKREVVQALDRQTGKQRWQAEWEGAMSVPFFAASNGSWIRSTPAYDGERVYVAGMRDVLVCLNAANGEEQWRVDFVKELKSPLPAFGFVSSPLVVDQAVYVQAGASTVKLDKVTGKILWRTLEDGGGMYGSAFSSPVIATLAGQQQLLVQGRENLSGVELEQGKVLWSQKIPAFRGMNILTPVVRGDTIFTSSYQNKSWLFSVEKESDQWRLNETWSNNAKGYMSTPVVIGDHLYIHLQNERLGCVNLQTGERTWTSQPMGKYSSLIAQGDRILCLSANGTLYLVRANPREFELLGSVKVGQTDTWAHLAISGDQLFVRELLALTAYRWKAQ
ncbi:MAG: PQQ-binding-like beta-propeller repeat protein [Pirellulales bacterium]|nr:PQQ-binding-like beta-propeller repeat protein [Pirellulales bacterium]